MDLSLINLLISKHDFCLRSWDNRYSKGIWVCIAPLSYQLEEVENATDAVDFDMLPATDFLMPVDWLPFVTGTTLTDALNNLEARLRQLPKEEMTRSSKWCNAVHNAIEHLKDVSNLSQGYGGVHQNKTEEINDYWMVIRYSGRECERPVRFNLSENEAKELASEHDHERAKYQGKKLRSFVLSMPTGEDELEGVELTYGDVVGGVDDEEGVFSVLIKGEPTVIGEMPDLNTCYVKFDVEEIFRIYLELGRPLTAAECRERLYCTYLLK
jgi:hypothetical protein